MSRQAFDRKLAALEGLRSDPLSPAVAAHLRKALKDRNNYVVSRAAALVAEFGGAGLKTDLLEAFDRFLIDPVKRDPRCWAKTAIIKALKALVHDEPEVYVKGIAHRQLEPGYLRAEDSATQLRGESAFGLINCRGIPGFEILGRLVDLLADPEKPARIDSARAIAAFGAVEGALALRLKIRLGDPEAEVIGACCSALIALDPDGGIPLVAGLLDSPQEDVPYEAAAALAESPRTSAFQALQSAWSRCREPQFRRALLISMGASRSPDAIDFLISLIAPGDLVTSWHAVVALAPNRFSSQVRDRVAGAVESTGSEELAAVFDREFEGKSGGTAAAHVRR